MQIHKFPSKDKWADILSRPVFDSSSLFSIVQPVLNDVRKNGDKALKTY